MYDVYFHCISCTIGNTTLHSPTTSSCILKSKSFRESIATKISCEIRKIYVYSSYVQGIKMSHGTSTKSNITSSTKTIATNGATLSILRSNGVKDEVRLV